MAVNLDKFWIAREFGGGDELSPASLAHALPASLGVPRDRLSRYARRDHDDHRGGHLKPVHRQAEREGRNSGGDGRRLDRQFIGSERNDFRASLRSEYAQSRESAAVEDHRKVDLLDHFIDWMQDKFWFVRKSAYPDFDQIMLEARDFANNPDATMVPLIFHEPRTVWAEEVLTGKDGKK